MLDVFIEGELVDLAIPTEDFAMGNIWYKWFNDKSINKYLEQGVFPNTKTAQVDFFKSMGKSRLALVVQNKEAKPLGIVSLSIINLEKRSCHFSLVIDNMADIRLAGFGALEASALIIEHGFKMLGVMRIKAGQHVDLFAWQQRLELIGFRFEGYHKGDFVKGSSVADSVTIAASYTDFSEICHRRGGRLWDSLDNMKKRAKKLPKESIRQKYDDKFVKVLEAYYDKVQNL
jgi:RimJ/RimL family protein N-acetyltransferase